MKNVKIIFLIAAIIMILGLQAWAEGVTTYPTYTPGQFSIMPAMLTEAEFTSVQAVPMTSDNSYYTNYYFKVKETLSGDEGKQWGNAANQIAVFIRQMPAGWVFNNGEIKTENLVGRTQVSASKADYYFVVTGPDNTKVTKLLENLENKYSPNLATLKDCGNSDSCFSDNMKSCTPAKATISDQSLTYIETIVGYEGSNCVITLVYTASPVPGIINNQMTCKIPKTNLTNYKNYLQGETMKQSCSGPLVDLLIGMGAK